MQEYNAIGLMSGSSLDGLDLAYVTFKKEDSWSFEMVHAETKSYSKEWATRLKKAPLSSAKEISLLHTDYGRLVGEITDDFIEKNQIDKARIACIASHGHTVFHCPEKNMTLQIGSGAHIAATTEVLTICDFRSSDIALDGQGAPIVPIGETCLFPAFDAYLNIGGIANMSIKTAPDSMIAFDVVVANQILNHLSSEAGLEYDDKGNIARQGNINTSLLNQLNQWSFYQKPFPKSLSNEHKHKMLTQLHASSISLEDKLCTYIEHVAIQIAHAIKNYMPHPISSKKMLATGGGVYNTFLVEQIQKHIDIQILIPDEKIVSYKEALIMAFLGIRRMRMEINVTSRATGARKDTIGGAIYLP